MKSMKKYGDKILSCIPEKWADFYRKAPNEFKQDYLDSMGVNRAEFIEFMSITNPNGKACGLFDWEFYYHIPSDFIYKHKTIYSALESWLLTPKEMELYNSMPDTFTQDDFRTKRIELGLPISSQDKFHRGSIFKHIPCEPQLKTERKSYWVYGSGYYSLEKTIIKPVLK